MLSFLQSPKRGGERRKPKFVSLYILGAEVALFRVSGWVGFGRSGIGSGRVFHKKSYRVSGFTLRVSGNDSGRKFRVRSIEFQNNILAIRRLSQF